MADAGGSAPKKDRLLSLGVHEFRTPVTVIAGYLRMLLTGRTGTLTDGQRKMLEEMEKTTARLSSLLTEMSDLSVLEAGGATLNRSNVDIAPLIQTEIASLPPLIDREVRVTFQNHAPDARVPGDSARLKTAFNALLIAHRRELVTCDELCVSLRRASHDGRRMLQVTIAGADRLAQVESSTPSDLTTFDEFRGGVGFTLPVARRIFDAHQAHLWSPADTPRAGAVLLLPEA
jgi:K+-sensing histidine kinase KdpD